MAATKTVTVTSQYQNNSATPTAVSLTVEAVVDDGVLKASPRVTNPGVFTVGTAYDLTP